MLSAIDFIKTKERMCNQYKDCEDCPIENQSSHLQTTCSYFMLDNPKVFVEILEDWLKKESKTNFDKFDEMFEDQPWQKVVTKSTCRYKECHQTIPCANCSWWNEKYKEDN